MMFRQGRPVFFPYLFRSSPLVNSSKETKSHPESIISPVAWIPACSTTFLLGSALSLSPRLYPGGNGSQHNNCEATHELYSDTEDFKKRTSYGWDEQHTASSLLRRQSLWPQKEESACLLQMPSQSEFCDPFQYYTLVQFLKNNRQ